MSAGSPSTFPNAASASAAAKAWLGWLAAMGVDDPLPSLPVRLAPRSGAVAPSEPVAATIATELVRPATRASARLVSGDREGVRAAGRLAAECRSLADIESALGRFEGCALRSTATRLCFADGNPQARVMMIGEAPGSEEDRQGKPFVGPSGQLIDLMLATISLDRTRVWITNSIFWRPPGNRAPTAGEIAVCQPFLERQIELLSPSVIVFVGGIAARAMLNLKDGVTRLRGRRLLYEPPGGGEPIPSLVMFHPAYLLRQPLNKRYAWRDLLTLQSWLAQPDRPH
jgi:DNA polymerase